MGEKRKLEVVFQIETVETHSAYIEVDDGAAYRDALTKFEDRDYSDGQLLSMTREIRDFVDIYFVPPQYCSFEECNSRLGPSDCDWIPSGYCCLGCAIEAGALEEPR